MMFLWNSEACNTLPINSWSISTLPGIRGPGRPVRDLMFVMYIGQSLFLIISKTWVNNKVNSVSSGISSVVSICKITLSVHCESVILLSISLKYTSTVWMVVVGAPSTSSANSCWDTSPLGCGLSFFKKCSNCPGLLSGFRFHFWQVGSLPDCTEGRCLGRWSLNFSPLNK